MKFLKSQLNFTYFTDSNPSQRRRNRTFHLVWGGGIMDILQPPPPRMSPAFWLYLWYESRIVFGETKVSLTRKKKKILWKTKNDKNIWVWNLKKAKKGKFGAILKISFFLHDFLRFLRAIVFSIFCFFLKKLFLVSSGPRLSIKCFFYQK